MNISPSTPQNQREFQLARVFDAPRDLVFAAWTQAEHLAKWWGPKGMNIRLEKLDLRAGGSFHYSMQSPDGSEMWGLWVFREVVPPERLVFVSSFADAGGNIVRPPFSDSWPLEILSTVTFEENDGKTTISMRGVPINATETERHTFDAGITSMQAGWKGTFDQLDAFLAQLQK